MVKDSDEHYMRVALREAAKGLGRTSPNPCVGAVIVQNDKIVSLGYHRKAGTPHAEVHALNAAGGNARGATMYVTLEPCSHRGRTPPCSHAVADAGIQRVVIGMLDPNPLVDGSGAEYLKERKIEVISGVLEEECRELNRPFIKLITTSLPWVLMKAGMSLDGRLSYRAGRGGVITGLESRDKVHKMRDQNDAILVGIGTVAADDPALTTRVKNTRGRDPLRIILDTNLTIDEKAKILNQVSNAPTWIFCSNNVDRGKIERLEDKGAVVHRVDECSSGVDLKQVLKTVAEHGYASVLVEGGARVHGCFLNQMLVDRVSLFIAPIFAGSGGVPLVSGLKMVDEKDAAIRLERIRTRKYGTDLMLSGDVVYPGKSKNL